jgi:hypothetical protein
MAHASPSLTVSFFRAFAETHGLQRVYSIFAYSFDDHPMYLPGFYNVQPGNAADSDLKIEDNNCSQINIRKAEPK